MVPSIQRASRFMCHQSPLLRLLQRQHSPPPCYYDHYDCHYYSSNASPLPCADPKVSFSSSSFGVGIGALLGAVAAFYSAYQTQIRPEVAYAEGEKVALDPEAWIPFKLEEVEKVSHNTQLLRFGFDLDSKLGLKVSSCILTRARVGTKADGKPNYVIRPYTPISDPDVRGYFDLLIKIYPEGKMSQHIANLKPGTTLEVKGPIPKLSYIPNMKRDIGMIAGGTGITPMLQVINAILKNPEDTTKVYLIYANVSPDDILLKEKLDALSSKHPNFKVHYVVDNAPPEWKGGQGYVSKDMIIKGMPSPSDDTLILVCGPPGMMKHISGGKAKDKSQGELSGLLLEAGYTKDMVYKF